MKHISVLLLAVLAAPLCTAEPDIAFPRELTVQLSSLPEAKLGFTQHIIVPVLQGENPLTGANNVDLSLSAEISPISANAAAAAVFTPIAFFQLSAGGKIGSGWNITLFGADVYGIGLNRPDGSGQAEHSSSAFDGLLWSARGGAALQFDLAALVPGDWRHIVVRSYHEANYKGYTAASAGQSWYFENDGGENINGFAYYGNLFAGYQMPIMLNTVGFLAEADLYLYDTPGRTQWGDEMIRWTFSGLFNAAITKQLSAALILQCRTRRNYRESNWKELYYRERHIDGANPLGLEFYRAVIAMTYKL